MDVKGSHALAAALSTSAREAWRHYTTMEACEPGAAAVLASRAARKQRQRQESRLPDQGEFEVEDEGVDHDTSGESPDCRPKRAVVSTSRVLAESPVGELRVQQLSVEASMREALHAEVVQGRKVLAGSTQPVVTPPLADQQPAGNYPLPNRPDDTGTGIVNSYLAESLSRELRAQQLSATAREREARFVEAVRRRDASGSESREVEEANTPLAESKAECPGSNGEHTHTTSANLEAKPSGVYLAESLVSELRMRQLSAQLCQCEANYVKAVLSSRDRPEQYQLPPGAGTSNVNDHDRTVLSTPDLTPPDTKPAEVVPKLTDTSEKELQDACSQTDPGFAPTAEVATNTPTRDLHSTATNTEPPPPPLHLQDSGVNTVLSYHKLMKSAQATEKYKKLQAEHRATVKELRQEKSQRMTSEQLVKIIQTDLSSVQQRNITETTTRLRLESEFTDVKVELGYARKQIEDKDQRISELEESLTGTSLLVRKLEEQNAVSLMNRGGIDYMVQAKLAEGRANEAEQKLRVLQVDLLQSQNEVKQLLERVVGAARERSEMVSSKVHVQLLQIADDRALAAEQKAQELEKEVQDLKRKLSTEKPTTDRKDGFASLSLSSSFPFSPYSGYSIPSYPTGTTLSSGWETKPLASTVNGSDSSSFSSSSYLGNVGLGSTGSMFSSSLQMPSETSALPKLHESPITTGPSSLHTSGSKQGTGSDTGGGSSAIGGGVFHTPALLPTALKPHALSTALPKANETDATADLLQTKTATEGSSLGFGLDLPSYDPSRAPDPTPVPTSTPRLKSQAGSYGGEYSTPPLQEPGNKAADGDSSDWSSSDEDTDRETPNPFVPSTHASLTAQWEWRTRHDSASADSTAATTSAAVKPVAHTPTSKRRPPPIAPKPNLRKPLEREPGHVMGEIVIAQELPCSFEEPARNAGLQLLATGFRRPRGPSGRSLPSRYLKQSDLFF